MKRPPPHHWLFVFKVIVESGSITEASERLNLTQSAVSQQIKSLEEYLGRQLVVRGKKGVTLTEVGKHYYNVIKVSLDKITYATDQLFGVGHKDVITLKSNYSFVDVWLARHIHEFYELYPDISVEVYTGLWLTDFGEIGRGIEIRYGDGNWSESVCHQLSHDTVYPVCSPRIRDQIRKPEDIFRFPLVAIMGNKIGWSEWCHHNQLAVTGMSASLYVESNLLAYQASISGNYISLGIDSLVQGYLDRGELVRIDAGSVSNRENFFVLEPSECSISDRERLFVDWLRSTYGGHSGQSAG